MKRGFTVFLVLLLTVSLSFVSAGLFSKNKITGEATITVPAYSYHPCKEFSKNSQYYFSICRDAGHGGVCFDKYSGEYQGCAPISGLYCTSGHANANKNIICSTEIPRIMYWDGKVNQHIDLNTGLWTTDPDGTSGSGIDKLTYCKKWYPNTVSVKFYKEETIRTWRGRGNRGYYESTKPSYECVQPNSIKCEESDGGINYYLKGQVVVPIELGEGFGGWDYCTNGEGMPLSNTGKYLVEWYCTSNGGANNRLYLCPNGCVNGACVQQTGKYCSVDATECGLEWTAPICGKVIYSADGSKELCEIPGVGPGLISAGFVLNSVLTDGYSCAKSVICPGKCEAGVCIKNTTDNLEELCLRNDIEVTKVINTNSRDYQVTITRKAGKDNMGIMLVFTNAKQSSNYVVRWDLDGSGSHAPLMVNQNRIIDINAANNNQMPANLNPVEVSVTKYFKDESGNPKLCSTTSKFVFRGDPTIPSKEAESRCEETDGGIDYSKQGVLGVSYRYNAIIKEDERKDLGGRIVSIDFIDSESVRLNIDGVISPSISKGNSYLNSMDTVKIEDIQFSGKGTTLSSVNVTIINSSATIFKDFCINEAILKEFYCEGNDGPYNVTRDCGMEGKICLNGACVKEAESSCEDSDGGIDYSKQGVLGVSYRYNAIVKEGKRENLGGRIVSIDFIDSESVRLNIDGVISPSISKGNSYSNGIDTIKVEDMYLRRGGTAVSSVNVTIINSPATIFRDSCINEAILNEFYCKGNVGPYNVTRDCGMEGKICLNGACVKKEELSCKDSDGGKNYHEKGTINFGGQIVFEDYCFNDVFNTNTELKEGVCYEDGSWGELYYQCPNGCVNGACVVDVPECVHDSDCDYGYKCLNRACVKEVVGNICESGCLSNGKCYPMGYRRSGTYCSEDNEFVKLLPSDSSCNNNFECRSNLCIGDECVDQSLINRFIEWLRNSFGSKK